MFSPWKHKKTTLKSRIIDEIFSPAMTAQSDQKQQKYKYHLSFFLVLGIYKFGPLTEASPQNYFRLHDLVWILMFFFNGEENSQGESK